MHLDVIELEPQNNIFYLPVGKHFWQMQGKFIVI